MQESKVLIKLRTWSAWSFPALLLIRAADHNVLGLSGRRRQGLLIHYGGGFDLRCAVRALVP